MTASQDARSAPKEARVVPAYQPGFLLGYDPFLEGVLPGIEDMARGNHLECGYCAAQRRTIHDLLIHVEVWHKEKAPIARSPVADRDDG